ncbi:MAG: ATPase [Chloroflexota bacterium]|nr:ATP-binding protein [Anaerolineales bacterium]
MNTVLRTLLYEWRDRRLPLTIGRDVRLDTVPVGGIQNATVITGFRRAGKTYLVYETIKKLLEIHPREDVVYINFEDERVLAPDAGILTDLLPEIQAVYGKKPKYLFLDEIQLIPNWSKWVRRVLDSEDTQIFITGSSSKLGSAELPTELRGRAWETHVEPLTFAEFLRFKQETVDFDKAAYVRDEEARIRFLFEEFLVFGGLPAVVLAPQEKKTELLQSYFQTVVGMDIAERHRLENILLLRTLLKLLLNSTYITVSKLHNNLKSLGLAVGKSSVDHYITHIESSYFMRELYIHNPAMINRLQYPRKVYFVDNGFMTALSSKYSRNMGRLLENFVFRLLSQRHENLFYYKDKKGNEVDFVVFENGRASALYQVCFSLEEDATRAREVRSLLKAGGELGCRHLILLYMEMPAGVEIPEEIQCKFVLNFMA